MGKASKGKVSKSGSNDKGNPVNASSSKKVSGNSLSTIIDDVKDFWKECQSTQAIMEDLLHISKVDVLEEAFLNENIDMFEYVLNGLEYLPNDKILSDLDSYDNINGVLYDLKRNTYLRDHNITIDNENNRESLLIDSYMEEITSNMSPDGKTELMNVINPSSSNSSSTSLVKSESSGGAYPGAIPDEPLKFTSFHQHLEAKENKSNINKLPEKRGRGKAIENNNSDGNSNSNDDKKYEQIQPFTGRCNVIEFAAFIGNNDSRTPMPFIPSVGDVYASSDGNGNSNSNSSNSNGSSNS